MGILSLRHGGATDTPQLSSCWGGGVGDTPGRGHIVRSKAPEEKRSSSMTVHDSNLPD